MNNISFHLSVQAKTFQNFPLQQILKIINKNIEKNILVCHFLPPVRPSQNFQKLSGATNAQNGRQNLQQTLKTEDEETQLLPLLASDWVIGNLY